MHKPQGYQNESIAYALAAGMVLFDEDERSGEKSRRRKRYERNRAHRGQR